MSNVGTKERPDMVGSFGFGTATRAIRCHRLTFPSQYNGENHSIEAPRESVHFGLQIGTIKNQTRRQFFTLSPHDVPFRVKSYFCLLGDD